MKPPKTNLEDALDEVLKQVSEAAVQAIRDYRDHKEPVPRELTHIKAKQAITNLFVSQFLEALPDYEQYGSNYEFTPKTTQKFIKEKLGETTGYNRCLKQIKDTIGRKWGK